MLLTALCVTLSVPAAAFAEGGDIASKPPVHTKTITPNNDGTYDLSLTVTGDTELSETKTSANVIVVQDVSGSMDNDVYTYSLEKTEKYDRDGTYGMVDGEPVKLERNWGFFGVGAYNYYLDANGKEVKYTGDMYHKVGRETGKTRLDVAKEALNSLADQLIASSDSTVKLSLETFSDRGNTPSQYYAGGQASDFKDAVNGLRADGGTNWVDALTKANAKANEDPNTPTYIIFLSDGEPTYGRDRWGTTGNGTTYRDEYFNNAVDEANKRPSNVAGLFTVYTGSEASEKMNSFAQKTTGGSAFDGTDSEKLNAAFANIIQTITKSAGYKDVKIVDKLSEYVTGTSANGAIDLASVSYQKNGETWAEAPAAVIGEDGTLSWDLSSVGELEKGTTYEVTFKVKPSQAAYDAAVNNGEATELPSNDGVGTKVFYKTVLKETGKDDQVSGEKSDGFNVPTFLAPVDTVTVKKEWANTNGAELPGSVTVQLQKDGQDYGDPFQLTAVDGWTKEIVVPAGVGQISWSVVETAVDGYDTSYSEAVTGTGVLTVTNTHKTWPGTLSGAANLTVTKNLTGRDWADGDSFKFKLEQTAGDASAVTMPESTELTIDSKTADHKAAFGDITFSAAGEFEFTITELGQSHDGVTYDHTKNVVKVSVEEKDGKFVATVTEGANPTFTNTYAAKSVILTSGVSVTKVLDGRDWKDSDSFEFTIAPKDNAPAPSKGLTAKATKDAQTTSFGDFTFDKAGTYVYEVSEVKGSIRGVSYDDHTATVTITVTDDGKGKLVATPNVGNGTFRNTYKAGEVTLSGDTAIKGQKTLTGRDMTSLFSFKLAADGNYGDAVKIAKGADTASVSGAEDGEAKGFSFGAVTFTKAGTYEFSVTEQGPVPDGYTYDDHASKVTVEVTDSGNGQLAASVKYGDGDCCVFNNSYNAESVTVIGADSFAFKKDLTGRALKAGEFSFTISSTDGPLPKQIAVTNDAAGNIAFGNITFDKAGVYHYNISEDTSKLPGGVTATTQGAKQVTVTVTDNGKGQLEAKVDTPKDVIFKNAYKPADTTIEKLMTTKVVKASQNGVIAPQLKGGDFRFTISSTNNGPLPEQTTVTNDAAGNIAFGAIKFTKPGEYHYTITESGSMAGVTNDSEPKNFTVAVKDNDDGTMTATASKIDGFVNTYTVQSTDYSVTTDVSIAKKLEGRALKAGEFKFQLLEGNKVVSEGTNDADGNVTFKSVKYTSADLGEHAYKVREVTGEAGGVTYDESEYAVTVSVTDNGDGTLSAKASSDGAIEFKNSYAADPTSVSFSATKVLDGAELKDGQFSFVLKDDEGNELQTAKNAADGTVSFQPVEFTGPGTHTFTIAEVNDGQANVAYDDASYQLTVNVTDDGEGHLSASVDGQAPVFKNTYTAPAQPKDDQKPAQKAQKKSIVPKTGDSTNIVAPVVIIVVAAACIVLGFLAKNKKK
ncbi:Spy0128 family protein [Paratractidigestivibacter sp.]|uniref:Spy0128 family protein n=1 Tax=Paratractidigestivibacter sp. TaxID=2847316 RepID=UPI003A93485D